MKVWNVSLPMVAVRKRSLLHRHDQILHDVVLPLGPVLAHVEGEDLLAVHLGRVLHPCPCGSTFANESLNSAGEISPSPSKRVSPGLPPKWFLQCFNCGMRIVIALAASTLPAFKPADGSPSRAFLLKLVLDGLRAQRR